ncbi:MAG: hypothetical protein QM773_05165 [Hyphomonadaceae bacterium]
MRSTVGSGSRHLCFETLASGIGEQLPQLLLSRTLKSGRMGKATIAMPDLVLTLLDDFEALVSSERASNYSESELEELYDIAIRIRTKIEQFPADFALPTPLLTLLKNINYGAIKREYRTWVLEDAEKAISAVKSRAEWISLFDAE